MLAISHQDDGDNTAMMKKIIANNGDNLEFGREYREVTDKIATIAVSNPRRAASKDLVRPKEAYGKSVAPASF